MGKGGRIKKFSEDKTVDVLFYTDDIDFWDIKNRLVLRYRGDYVTDLMEMTPTPVNPMTGVWYINHEVDESNNESKMETSTSGVINDMERVLYEEERARVLVQVKLFFHFTQGEETNGLTPMTIRHFGTQDFTPTLAYEECRDVAEEVKTVRKTGMRQH